MADSEIIKRKIKILYEKNPNIHVNVSITHPKIDLKNSPAIIKSVYPHFFLIEENSSGTAKTHTLKYSDIISKQVEIIEMSPLHR